MGPGLTGAVGATITMLIAASVVIQFCRNLVSLPLATAIAMGVVTWGLDQWLHWPFVLVIAVSIGIGGFIILEPTGGPLNNSCF